MSDRGDDDDVQARGGAESSESSGSSSSSYTSSSAMSADDGEDDDELEIESVASTMAPLDQTSGNMSAMVGDSPSRAEHSVARSVMQQLSPSRRHVERQSRSTLGDSNVKWEKRQAHRRLREMMTCFRSGAREVAGEVGQRKSFGLGPDRGRLILECNASRGLEALAPAGGRAEKLPPVPSSSTAGGHRIMTVMRDAATGRVCVRDKAAHSKPTDHENKLLVEMGYHSKARDELEAGKKEVEISATAAQVVKRNKSIMRRDFLNRHQEMWARQDEVQEVIEQKAEDVRRLEMQLLFPHIDTEAFPPRISGAGSSDTAYDPSSRDFPAVKRGRALLEKLDQQYRLIHPEEFVGIGDADGSLVVETTADVEERKLLEDPVKLVKQVDDRSWGLTANASEAANKLRQRFQVVAPVSNAIVPDSSLSFGSVDRLLEISADAAFHLPKTKSGEVEDISADLLVQQPSLHISMMRLTEECHLYVLCVGVAGTNPIGLPYSEAERNARWVSEVFRAIGADVELVLGFEATQEGIRAAQSSLLSRARASRALEPKVIAYFSGRGRVNEEDQLTFVPCDAIELMAGPAVHLNPRVVNLQELSERQVLDRFSDTSSPSPSPQAAAATNTVGPERGKPFSRRWSYPIVIAELLIERAETDDGPTRELKTDAERMDFWRSEYHGVVIAPEHQGGNLSVTCSFRHHSLVSYYLLKCFDGRLTGVSQHIGTIPQMVQFVATKLRKRNIPTLVLKCPPMPPDAVARSSEEIIHASQTFYPSAIAKATTKASRSNRKCRFQLICEVDARYRCNPAAFVTRLVARFREVIMHNKVKSKKAPSVHDSVALSMWLGSRRMEHRLYLPINVPLSMDQCRYDMLHIINSSSLTHNSRTGELAAARALETLENVRMECAKLDHCVVIYSAGQLQNRWGKIPAAHLQQADASMSFRPKEELENDFVTFMASSGYQARDFATLEFLFEKVFTDLITVQGMGSHNDVRKLAKMLRFGLLDTLGTCNCRIERLEVTSFGAQEAEAEAAIFVQRMVRRYLTGRVMRSRLSAAMTFVRSHTAALEKSFTTYSDELVVIFYEYQEEIFSTLERETARCRRDIFSEEAKSFLRICTSCVASWVDLEHTRRRAIFLDYSSETLTLSKYHLSLPLYAVASRDCAAVSAVEHFVRNEKLVRQRMVVEEYATRCDVRTMAKLNAQEISARRSPVKSRRAPVRQKKTPMTLDQLNRLA